MTFLKQNSKWLVLLSILIAGIFINAPYTNFQNFLSQGDHGRDLYAAQAVYRGELPYKDFWWVYGPLMPYYYGLFFKIFGTQITSMILGKLVLKVAGALLIALAMMEIASPLAAFLCACWFMLFQQDFFFTYNHLGGMVMDLGIVLCLFSYIKNAAIKSAWGALGFIFVLCLIKINFGLAALFVAAVTIGVCDFVRGRKIDSTKKYFYLMAIIGIPVLTFLIYWSLLKGLSVMEIRQCLPYLDGDQPYTTSIWAAVISFLQITFNTITSNWTNLLFAIIINGSALRCIYLLVKDKLLAAQKIIFLLAFGLLCFFYVANFHEYLKSGVWYRGFWSQPLSMMMIFLLIDTATTHAPQYWRKIVFTFLIGLALYTAVIAAGPINAFKTDSQYLSIERGKVYITNSQSWISTVQQTTEYLKSTLKPNELFFALPYDCLYYYLTDKKTPTRQLIFFEHIKIPPEQERSVIAELEKNHVNYVLLSNRAFARQEPGLGFLGTTYCPLIGKYLSDNFVALKRFGDWSHEPGWAWNHGTLILKRKGS